MKESNVIQFPQEKVTQKKLRDSKAHSRASLGLSLLSVLMVTLFLNQWVSKSKSESVISGGRGVASIGSNSISPGQSIQWEQELAKKLAEAKAGNSGYQVSGFLGEKPSLRDELIFGALDGKYGMNLMGGRIQSLSFISGNDASAVMIQDRKEFLKKYNSLFVVAFDQVSLASKSEDVEVYNLIDAQKTVVGAAKMTFDLSGKLVEVKIQ